MKLRIVIAGLSITSAWGNGHATTYRAIVRALHGRGHEVTFLERDVPWYAAHRDMPAPPYGRTILYADLAELQRQREEVRQADLVLVGSYVPDGTQVLDWMRENATGLLAFYDIDTPVTLAGLETGATTYLRRDQIPELDVYLSFTGGPTLRRIERVFGAPVARPWYCSVDPDLYYAAHSPRRWHLGYLGTYSADRQPTVERLLMQVARRCREGRFVVAGPQYPPDISWPPNVERVTHLSPEKHRAFYSSQKFTLNVTRADMIAAGYSPSVRLFEAAACATPVISDEWAGLETFFTPGSEILVAHSTEEAMDQLLHTSERDRNRIGNAARRRCLAEHTAGHRALELERLVLELNGRRRLAGPTLSLR